MDQCCRDRIADLQRAAEAEKKRADFWERQCQAQGRDLQKALEEIKRLGGVPCV
jgi:hypothetical protein